MSGPDTATDSDDAASESGSFGEGYQEALAEQLQVRHICAHAVLQLHYSLIFTIMLTAHSLLPAVLPIFVHAAPLVPTPHRDAASVALAETCNRLQGTSIGRSFAEPPEPSGQPSEGPAAAQQDGEAGLQPVNVDLNLVQSLLASYGAQQGLPGPAGNLATALGLQLHREEQEAHD